MKMLFVQKMNGISGSELYLLQIMPELKKRGHDVEMLIVFPVRSGKNDRFVEVLHEHNIPVHEMYGNNSLSPFLFSRIKKLLKNGKYDLVQPNLVHADLWIALIKKFSLPKLKVISVKHGFDPGYMAKYGHDLSHLNGNLFFWIERFACRVVDHNVTISLGLFSAFVDGKICPANRIENVYYGLTLAEPVEKEEPKLPSFPYVLITGRLVGFKGHKLLMEAWKRAGSRLGEVKLVIAGNGAMRQELEEFRDNLGLQDEVFFWGHVPNPHPLMKNSLFTIVTSKWEGFGLILLESWLHQKAIVAFDTPAFNEVIEDGKTGLIAKADDTVDLAEKIIWLSANPGAARQYGIAGYEKLHSFYTLKRMTDEMEIIYKRLVPGATHG